jgi:transposase-like protein
MTCKYCQSQYTIKFGTYTTEDGIVIQRYFCNDCKRKFVPDTLPKMQTPADQVSAAMGMYYRGMSLDGIQGQIEEQFGNKVAESTIYYWISRFTKEAIEQAKGFMPEVGDVWIADETGIDVHGSNRDLWFWDIIDSKTRYLLASHISRTRTTEDARILIQKAVQRAGKYPRVIITDKLHAYIGAVSTSAEDIQHVRSKPFTTINSTNKIERFHGTFKDRTKVVRAFKNPEAADLITQVT